MCGWYPFYFQHHVFVTLCFVNKTTKRWFREYITYNILGAVWFVYQLTKFHGCVCRATSWDHDIYLYIFYISFIFYICIYISVYLYIFYICISTCVGMTGMRLFYRCGFGWKDKGLLSSIIRTYIFVKRYSLQLSFLFSDLKCLKLT